MSEKLAPLHRRYLSMACACTVVGKGSRRNDYIEAAIESSYLSLILAARGIENSSCVLVRQTIELVLKHIFFSSHAVEYTWASNRVDYKDLTFQYLLEFTRRTDEYRNAFEDRKVGERIDYWYGELSRHVHVQSKYFMGYQRIGLSHGSVAKSLQCHDEKTKELWPILVAVLVAAFPLRYLKSSVTEQRAILHKCPVSLRRHLQRYLRDLSTA